MTNDTPSGHNNECKCCGYEYAAAFLLLRLFLGLRTLMAGVEKFESKGSYSVANYTQNMDRMSQGITSASFLPLWMTKGFAHSLGWALLIMGVAVLLGIKSRVTLTLTGLLYIALSFGLLAVQEQQGVSWLAIYIAMFAGALVLSKHERLAVWADRK